MTLRRQDRQRCRPEIPQIRNHQLPQRKSPHLIPHHSLRLHQITQDGRVPWLSRLSIQRRQFAGCPHRPDHRPAIGRHILPTTQPQPAPATRLLAHLRPGNDERTRQRVPACRFQRHPRHLLHHCPQRIHPRLPIIRPPLQVKFQPRRQRCRLLRTPHLLQPRQLPTLQQHRLSLQPAFRPHRHPLLTIAARPSHHRILLLRHAPVTNSIAHHLRACRHCLRRRARQRESHHPIWLIFRHLRVCPTAPHHHPRGWIYPRIPWL